MSSLNTTIANPLVSKLTTKLKVALTKPAPKSKTLSAQKVDSYFESAGGEFRGM